MKINEWLGADRARAVLDRLIPAHAYRADNHSREWTTARGVFSLTTRLDGGMAIRFVGAGWEVTVPASAPGVEAIRSAMEESGAIERPVRAAE